MPNSSMNTLASGARQFVVQDAFEMIECTAGSYVPSLTPSTRVATSSPVAGAEMTTFFAPAVMCLCAFSDFVKRAVA